MTTWNGPLFYVNNSEALIGTLNIDQPAEVMWSSGPRPDPRWTFIDGQGHWHAYSEERHDRYPTLESRQERVECDGSCGGVCEGEGYRITHYNCRICGEEVEPGSIPGPFQVSIPGLKEWSAKVEGAASLRPNDRVTVRVVHKDEVKFGVALVAEISWEDDQPAVAKLIGVGPLGTRKAERSHAG